MTKTNQTYTLQLNQYIGGQIRNYRQKYGVTQKQLANAIGTSFQQIQKYEKGQNRIGSGRLYVLAKYLNVPVETFFPKCSEIPLEITLVDTQESLLICTYRSISQPILQRILIRIARQIAEEKT